MPCFLCIFCYSNPNHRSLKNNIYISKITIFSVHTETNRFFLNFKQESSISSCRYVINVKQKIICPWFISDNSRLPRNCNQSQLITILTTFTINHDFPPISNSSRSLTDKPHWWCWKRKERPFGQQSTNRTRLLYTESRGVFECMSQPRHLIIRNPNNSETLGTDATNQNLHFRGERLRPLSN